MCPKYFTWQILWHSKKKKMLAVSSSERLWNLLPMTNFIFSLNAECHRSLFPTYLLCHKSSAFLRSQAWRWFSVSGWPPDAGTLSYFQRFCLNKQQRLAQVWSLRKWGNRRLLDSVWKAMDSVSSGSILSTWPLGMMSSFYSNVCLLRTS